MSNRSRLTILLAALLVLPVCAPATLRASDPSAAQGKLVQRCYQVADLVVPVDGLPCGGAEKHTLEKSLVNLIRHMVAAETWSDRAGPGTVDFFPLGMCLVVKQTPEVHEQIEALLKTLRRMQDVEVACEVRIVSLEEGFSKRICGDFGISTKANPRVSFLNEDQMRMFFEKIQSDAQTNVMQTPKMTLLNGQARTLQACDSQFFVTGVNVTWDGERVIGVPQNRAIETGLVLSLQPVMAPDGDAVRLHLQAKLTALESEKVGLSPVITGVEPIHRPGQKDEPLMFTQFIQTPKVITLKADKVLSIPQGRTAVLSGWKRKREVCKKWALPLLGEVPYVKYLVSCEWQEPVCERVLLLVTPKVVVQAAQEEVQPIYSIETIGATLDGAKPDKTRTMDKSTGKVKLSVPTPAK